MDYTKINAETVDRWVDADWEWGRPIPHEVYKAALQGTWDVVLTPTKPVPHAWFPTMQGCRMLGLASGGGQQMPIFTALGATCTVLDYSQRQLDSERMVAQREDYDIQVVQADMTKRLPFEDGSFDAIFHPVSNCYVEDIYHVWRECFRVLRPGGVLLAGWDNGFNYVFDDTETTLTNRLPFNPLKDPELYKKSMAQNDGIQFSHTLAEQIGGQLQTGFILKDLYEDTNDSGPLFEFNIPTFVATLSVKPE